jgi:glycosyltransferase involved in cell wall biosynthesis
MKYKIAIIIPFYNPKKFIKISLSNILKLAQKFKNIEIIYVDNNSTDNSYEIVKDNIVNYNNIRIFQTTKKYGQGPGIARNLGVLKSNSEYILYLDADDVIRTNNIENFINRLGITNINIMYLKKISEKPSSPYLKYNKKNLKIFFRNTNNMEVISIAFSKNFLMKNKIFFHDQIYEDIFYLFKCHYFNKKKIFFYKKIIYEKKFYKNSITNSKPTISHFRSKFEAWKSIYIFLKKKLTKVEFNKISSDIQYRWRGEFANEYSKILKLNLNLKDKNKFIEYIVQKYLKYINKEFTPSTLKDKIVKNILNQNKSKINDLKKIQNL